MTASGADQPVSLGLPWPHEWAMGPRKRELLNTAFVGIIAVGMAWMAWLSLRDGDHEMALVSACLATLCAVLVCGAPFMWVRRRVSARAVVADTAGSGEQCVSIQYSRPWFGFLVVLMATLGAMCAVAVPVMLMDDLSSQSAFQAMMIPLLVVVGLWGGWFVLGVVRGHVVRGHVMLTPRGVHHRHLVYRDFVPWSSVVAVTAANGPGPVVQLHFTSPAERSVTTRAMTLRTRPPTEYVRVYGRPLAVDPAVLYHALRYYTTRPDARGELATSAGVQRVRNADLVG